MAEQATAERKPYKLRHPIVQGGVTKKKGDTVQLTPKQVDRVKAYEEEMDQTVKQTEGEG